MSRAEHAKRVHACLSLFLSLSISVSVAVSRSVCLPDIVMHYLCLRIVSHVSNGAKARSKVCNTFSHAPLATFLVSLSLTRSLMPGSHFVKFAWIICHFE